MTPTNCRTELSIAGNDESCGPCTPPTMAPVSCCGKKPLGILKMSTTFNTIVSSNTTSISPELSSTQSSVRR